MKNHTNLPILALILGLFCFTGSAQSTPALHIPRASITPQELGIIIAEGDPLSEAIGTLYQTERGIPPENIVRIPLRTGDEEIPLSEFARIKALVDAQLPAHIQATLLTWTKPFGVKGICRMSITSAFALQWHSDGCLSSWLNDSRRASPYFNSESTKPWDDFGIRPSMMLGATDLAKAQALIARGKAAEASYPGGTGYLIRTTDAPRSVRWQDFSELPAAWSFPGGLTLNYIDNATGSGSNYISGKTDVLFYFTGLTSIPALTTNTYLPGAAGDHLTSYGGVLSGGNGQMMATAWLDAGMTGSFGTVEEPFAITAKFPQASVMIDHYYRGASLVEAYWKSVRWPTQGLFLGDPLARPFTDMASSSILDSHYNVHTRRIKPGEYAIEYRDQADGPWINWSRVTITQAGPAHFQIPIVPSSAVETRLTGPCSTYFGVFNSTESIAGDRAQNAYFRFEAYNEGKCIDQIKLSALPRAGNTANVSAEFSKPRFQLQPGEWRTVDLKLSTTEGLGTNGARKLDFDILLTRSHDTAPESVAPVTLNVLDNLDASAPTLRIARPGSGWWYYANPLATARYPIQVEADVKPGSGIHTVEFSLEPAPGSSVTPSPLSRVVVSGPNYSGTLVVHDLLTDGFLIRARAYDHDGREVAREEKEIYLYVDSAIPLE